MKIMSIPYRLCTCIFVLSASVICTPQEKPLAEDFLKWFPEGKYDMYSHADFEKFNAARGDELLGLKLTPKLMAEKAGGILPITFMKSFKSVSSAHLVKYEPLDEVAEQNEDEQQHDRRRLSPIEISFVDQNGKMVHRELHERGRDLWVFRFFDLDRLIKSALKKGDISETGETAYNIKIYSYGRKDGTSTYLYPADIEELLVASSLEDLKRMIDAGYSASYSLVEDPSFKDFKEVFPALGCMWINRNSSLRYRTQYEEYKKLGAPEEILEKYRNQIESIPDHDILSYHFADHVTSKWIRIYADEEIAEKRYKEDTDGFLRGHTPRAGHSQKTIDFFNSVKSKTSFYLDGKAVVIETIQDEEYFQKQREMYESYKKSTDKDKEQ